MPTVGRGGGTRRRNGREWPGHHFRRLLSAVAFDAQNNVLDVPLTWASSDAAIVGADETGTVVAAVPSGALITASAGAVQSEPIYVYLAAPVAGALLLVGSSSRDAKPGRPAHGYATVDDHQV